MAGPVQGQWGGEDIILNDAATETTALQILAAINRMSGGSNTDQSQKAAELFKKSNMKAAKAASATADAVSGLGSAVSGAFSSMIGTIRGLGEELLIGGNRISDFSSHITGAMSGIPVFGTALGGLTQLFISVVDNQIDTFRELSGVGMDLGGDLFEAKRSAIQAGLSLETFQQTLMNNSVALTTFGGSAREGARRFKETSGVLQRNFGKNLSALGLTMDETAQFTAEYMELQNTLGRNQKFTAAGQAQATNDYIMQLDGLSRVTGKQREEVAAMLQQQANDKRMKALLASMDGDVAKTLQNVTTSIAAKSPELAEAVTELVATGGVPLNNELAKSISLMSPALREASAQLRDGTITEQQYVDVLNREITSSKDKLEVDGKNIATMSALGNTAYDGVLALASMGDGLKSVEEVSKEQADAQARGQKSLLDFERMIQQVRNVIFGALVNSGIFDTIMDSFESLTEMFSVDGESMGSGLTALTDKVKEIASGVSKVFGKFVSDVKQFGFDKAFSSLWSETLKPKLSEAWEKITTGIKETVWPMFRDGMQSASDYLTEKLTTWWEGIDFKQILKENWKTFGAVAGGLLIGAFIGIPALIGGALILGIGALFGAGLFLDISEKLSETWTSFTDGIHEMFSGVAEFFRPAVDAFRSVADGINIVISGITGFISDIISKIPGVGLVTDGLSAVSDFFGFGEEKAEKAIAAADQSTMRVLESEEKIAALKEDRAREQEKFDNAKSRKEKSRAMEWIRMYDQAIAQEEAALANTTTAKTQSAEREVTAAEAAAMEAETKAAIISTLQSDLDKERLRYQDLTTREELEASRKSQDLLKRLIAEQETAAQEVTDAKIQAAESEKQSITATLDNTASTVADLAKQMGIDPSEELSATLHGGVPTEINGQPVPMSMLSEDQKNNILAAKEVQSYMPDAGNRSKNQVKSPEIKALSDALTQVKDPKNYASDIHSAQQGQFLTSAQMAEALGFSPGAKIQGAASSELDAGIIGASEKLKGLQENLDIEAISSYNKKMGEASDLLSDMKNMMAEAQLKETPQKTGDGITSQFEKLDQLNNTLGSLLAETQAGNTITKRQLQIAKRAGDMIG